jgi:adenylate cyclase
MKRKLFASVAPIAGALTILVIGVLWALDGGGIRSFLREHALDLEMPPSRAITPPPIVVVDIDSEALRRYGPWPWSRLILARIVDALTEAQPAVVGLDMLLAGEDRLSPAAVARRLATETGRGDLAAIAGELADGDAELSRALARTQAVLGAVLALESSGTAFPGSAPILVRGAPHAPRIWGAEAVIWPMQGLAQAAAGVGLIVFDNDADGVARRVPLLALAGGAPVAGFAASFDRRSRGAAGARREFAVPRLAARNLGAPHNLGRERYRWQIRSSHDQEQYHADRQQRSRSRHPPPHRTGSSGADRSDRSGRDRDPTVQGNS